jgi:hypothetical protein
MIKTLITLALCVIIFCLAYSNVFAQFKTKKYDEKSNLINWSAFLNPKEANFYVYNETEIKVPAETVWNILIDAKKWHTFYKGVEKPVQIMDSTHQTLAQNVSFSLNTMGISLVPVIKEFIPNERMAWEVNTPKLKAYHAWLIIPTQAGCRLITPEAQNGFLTFLQKIFQPNKLLNLHEHWLEVIKARAEGTTPQLGNDERIKMEEVLNNSASKFNKSVINLSEAQINFRPSPNKWTIAECIEHVTLAEMEFPKILANEMQKPAHPELRNKIKILDEAIQPKMTDRSWKAKSPEIFKPANKNFIAKETISLFNNQRKETIAYVEVTKDDLRNHFWKHPLTGTIDLYQTLLLMSAHLERHTEQIEQIKLSPQFPNK